jgi:hypothetical protein
LRSFSIYILNFGLQFIFLQLLQFPVWRMESKPHCLHFGFRSIPDACGNSGNSQSNTGYL